MLLFEFVHHQEYSFSQDRIMAVPASSPSMGAQSWYKPAVKVVHYDTAYGATHEFEPVREGEDRNQVVTGEPWTWEQFEEWSKQ